MDRVSRPICFHLLLGRAWLIVFVRTLYSHCVFGTMVRFHQGDHRFWLRDQTTQDSARDYLNMRYKLAPSLM